MSSSPYPVLDNRPIDHWKVTELKEELKKRKLTTKGLKDDLVKRLAEALHIENENNEALLAERTNAEALRIEKENAEKNANNGVDDVPHFVDGVEHAKLDKSLGETAINIVDSGVTQNDKAVDGEVKVYTNDSETALSQGEVKEGDTFVGTDSASVEVHVDVHTTIVETVTTVSESVTSEVAIGGQDLQNTETQKENGNSKPQAENEDLKPLLEDEVLMTKPEDKDIESKDSMAIPETSPPNNQVSEVSPTLGSQVKSDSISTDSISINEKIELKDNIIADNVKIELDVVKPEMVEPSSNDVDPIGGESHPMDVEEPQENKTSVEGKNDDNAANTDMSKKNYTVDVGYSEKLNLDRSSGDDSMEDDLPEARQVDSKDNSDNVVDMGEKTEVPSANEEAPVDVVGDGISLNKEIHVDSLNHAAATLVNKENPIPLPAEKRKLNDQAAIVSPEPLKRQRRWNTPSVKVPESQSPNLTPTTTPKTPFQPTALKRNLSISGSKSSEDAPKERIVPPSQKPPTNSLRIDHFLRPFTLKAVQELLGKTGSVENFWMDQIKTHCFVTYSSVEEATETRNAVYNLQWPTNGGRLLVAEFVDPQEVTTRLEAPQTPTAAAPVNARPAALSSPPAAQPVPSPRQPVPRHEPLPPPPPLPSSNLPPPREHLPPPPPPPVDPPIVTLDDLFQKTKAVPRIYYLPLSEEQVAAKLAARGKKQQV